MIQIYNNLKKFLNDCFNSIVQHVKRIHAYFKYNLYLIKQRIYNKQNQRMYADAMHCNAVKYYVLYRRYGGKEYNANLEELPVEVTIEP